MLVDLTLFLEDKEENMPLDISCDLFSNCPSLTGLSWGPGFGPSTNQHLLAWGQIRMLHLYFTDIFDSLRGVTLGANIERLGLYHCSGESTSPLPLPGVTKLSITATLTDEAYCPFKYLTLRRLSSLDISRGPRYNVGYYAGGEIWKDWDETPIRDFFDRSGCTLTLLSLRGVLISDEQLIQLLRLMPALSSLRLQEFFGDQDVITNRTVTRRFLQKLTVDNTSSPLLPKLTEIFLVLHEDGLADTVLPHAVISRWVPDSSQLELACIKSVAVVFANESEETIEGLTLRLRSLKERGVWVSVGSVEVVTVDVEDAEDAEDVEDEAS
ncbi:hypothetical protein MPER_07681 [Moniliophthora perniciosa FA553]|nr:hypothetical protein MPER_07681 [Moniliophthora perniciosa FA553]